MKTCKQANCTNPVFSHDYCRFHQYKRTDMKMKATKKSKPKKKLITITKLKKKAQEIFNAYIRERDSQDGYFTCISCGKTLPVEVMNAGHYVPVKGGSFLIMNEFNVNGECAGCNCFDEFHLIGYRRNLVSKIGEDAVMWLEDHRRDSKKWTRSELLSIIDTYSKQVKAA